MKPKLVVSAVLSFLAFTACADSLPRPNGATFDSGALFSVAGYAAGKPALANFPVLVRIAEDSPAGFSYDDLRSKSTGADLAFVDMDDEPISVWGATSIRVLEIHPWGTVRGASDYPTEKTTVLILR